MENLITREVDIPRGLSGIMSYTHIKTGKYPVGMAKPEYVCNVIVKEANEQHLLVDLEVSENLAEPSKQFVFQLQAIEASGILNEKLVYYK